MEVDSPSSEPNILSPHERILQRLHQFGVEEQQLIQLQPGLVDYVKENRSMLTEIIYAILPSDENLEEMFLESKADYVGMTKSPTIKDQFRESMKWLQWLMFENDPRASLKTLAKLSVNQRGVCGAVWGQNDIAYRCRTCEHDPTCAICVPCFQNGNHKDHDYSLMYTGGGCCDCGDVTAWKREGFCSKHKGAEQIQPLSEQIANSVGPVLDVILNYWKEKLNFTQINTGLFPKTVDPTIECVKISDDLTASIVEMLLEFCKFSESLLSFISRRVFSTVGLLDILVRAERFLSKNVVKKLHELLLKLLGEPTFKYEFAKVFIKQYPSIIIQGIKERADILEKYPLLSTFSVQIFTVPTLTPRLVKEMNLLEVLLGCVVQIFYNCLTEDSHIEVGKWASLYETTVRVIEDTRYVMSHAEVPKFITHENPDTSRTWIQLLAFVQGMNPQKRITGLHVEDENEHTHLPFVLGHYIANIHSLLVAGAFSGGLKDEFDDSDGLHLAKVGKLSEESSVCSTTGRSNALGAELQVGGVTFEGGDHISVPKSVMWLTNECLREIESWLEFNSVVVNPHYLPPHYSCKNDNSSLALKRTFSRVSNNKASSKAHWAPTRTHLVVSREHHRFVPSPTHSGLGMCLDLDSEQSQAEAQNFSLMGTTDMDVEYADAVRGSDEATLKIDSMNESESGVLSLADWPDIDFDVSSQDISVHIPLHRLLAMLLQKILNRCYDGSKGFSAVYPNSHSLSPGFSHDFFGLILGRCHPFGFSASLMEHPLRIRVFCAQVRAGMWRKNGDAAILSCEWYRSVRWSEQGLELDLFLLQCCAALAPPDLFVKRILDRFGLTSYLSLSLERSNEYEPILLQEMLNLMIQIVKERRFCGHSTSETLRRELIYKLVIGDATHSQLVKSLPNDLSKNDQLQDILDTVAVYANPSEMKQGKYSLRKAYWEELDLYHPRWNSRDLQIAEERYLRFCKVSPLTVQLPRWTDVFRPLNGISRIATCRAVLEIVRAVLFYAVCSDRPSLSRAPDGVLITALHLLSLALDICHVWRKSSEQFCSTSHCTEDPSPVLAFAIEKIDIGVNTYACKPQSLLMLLVSLMTRNRVESVNNYSEAGQPDLYSLIKKLLKTFAELDERCMIKLKKISPEVVSHLLPPIKNSDADTSSSTSDVQDRKAKAKERQAAILEKMKAAQSKFIESLKSTSNEEVDDSTSSQDVYMSDEEHLSEEPLVCSLCRDPNSRSPVSFMVLLQKSRLASFAEKEPPSWEKVYALEKERKSKTKKEGAVDEISNDALPGEVDAFLDFIKARIPVSRHSQLPSSSNEESMKTPTAVLDDNIYLSIQKDMQDILQHSNVKNDVPNNSTSIAGKDLNDRRNVESLLLGKYAESLSRETSEHPSVSKIARNENTSLKTSIQFVSYDGFGPTNCDGIHVSSCGHAVHQDCRDRYLSSLRERYNRRIVFEGGHVVDPDQGEFLCPVCRRLANSVLPMFPSEYGQVPRQMTLTDNSSEAGTDFPTVPGAQVLYITKALSLLQTAASVIGKGGVLQELSSLRNERMQTSLGPVFRRLCRMYFPDKCEKLLESGRVSHSMVFWDTLKYSLISTEIAARSGRPTSSTEGSVSGIAALYRELDSSSGFILSLLLQVVQSTRSENSLQMLLRYRGIQLFRDSVCSGVSIDQSSTDTGSQQGNILSMSKNADKGIAYPDVQFWKRAADPVLAHDPFSSMMWILFSLPRRFLSSVDSFLSLVHLFYTVSVIQALVSCCGHDQLDITKLGSGDCLIGDICKIKGESVAAQKYFVSHNIDFSCHPKDAVRLLSHPYLRRCALLWKLLKSSMSAPFCSRSHQWDVSSLNRRNDMLLDSTSLSAELKEVEKLENMFQIPDLDSILMDKELYAVSMKWFHHFCKESENQKYARVLHLTPAVPFRLMQLPRIYQDLLERYIKQQCPECKTLLPDPALCLLCGRLCSPSWKPCCRESGCHAHAMSCGAGIGVFLLIRKTTILLQRSARHAPWPSPYLDAFGEEDIEMNRGKPLYLNEERYTALTHMVASHGLDQSSEVLRQTTMDALFLI